jgi:peptidoglycan/LPS O-acetylase OafA/YrhL
MTLGGSGVAVPTNPYAKPEPARQHQADDSPANHGGYHPEPRSLSKARGVRLAFRGDVEGMRGIAILLVAAYHARLPGFRGGFVGVDVFFVLSGYLITGLLVKEISTTGKLNFWEFYARRARRLLPAAALVLAVTLVASRFIYPPFQQLMFGGTALATAAYISNLWFASAATNYLAPDASANPFLHTWSLSVEEQFYLVWPLLLACTAALGAVEVRFRRLVAVMFVLVIASLALSVWLTRIEQPVAFFGPTRAWEFGIGGLGALLSDRVPRYRLAWVAAWGGIVAILAAAALFGPNTVFPGMAALVPVVGTVAVLGTQSPFLTWLLSRSPLQWFGRLSYSWYLWHWPVLVLGGLVIGRDTLLVRLLCLAVALALAWMTFLLLERPVRSSVRLTNRPGWSLAMAVCITLVSLSVAWTIRKGARESSERPDQRMFTAAYADTPTLYSGGCHLSYLETMPKQDCVFGDRHGSATVALFGDSHAAQWFPALERIAAERHFKLVTLTKSGCPAAAVDTVEPALGRSYVECTRWRDIAIDTIKKLHADTVVMASAGMYVAADLKEPGTGVSPDEWFRGTYATLSRLVSGSTRVLLIRDTPAPEFDVPSCLARAAWNPRLFAKRCTFDRRAARVAEADAAEVRAAAAVTGVSTLDVSDAICQGSVCDPQASGMIAYRDSHHLTTQFAKSIAPLLAAKLDVAGLGEER